jgi:hypothetical protein
MPGEYDARFNQLSVVDQGTSFTLDTLASGKDFDVIADIEVGESLNEVISRIQIWVSVGNLTQLIQVQSQVYDNGTPGPAKAPRNERITIPFKALTGVNEGDLLEAVATLKVTAGVLSDISDARSQKFIFTSP